MPKYDITLTITVEAVDALHAWEKGDEAICSIDKSLICREIMDVGEPTLVEEEKHEQGPPR